MFLYCTHFFFKFAFKFSAFQIFGENNKLIPDVRPYSKDSQELEENHPLQIMVTWIKKYSDFLFIR